MKRILQALALVAGLVPPAFAQGEAPLARGKHSIGADIFYSTDADQTDVARLGINLDWKYQEPERYRGLRVERAWFNPVGRGWEKDERVYIRAADSAGDWRWSAKVGTDGKTLLGAATVRQADYSREFFIERELVETPRGVDRGIYYTFAGAAFDLPANDRNLFTVVGGLQKFSGDNLRKHIRANFVHMLAPDNGISAQLRTRYFRDSHPREYDYFSPRWYTQILPLLQVRRSTDDGWRYLIAGGLGLQKASGAEWRRSTYLNAQITAPVTAKWALESAFLFNETPSGTGTSYRYMQVNAAVRRTF